MVRVGGWFVVLTLLLGVAAPGWAATKARVDRTVLTLGETLRLVLERDGGGGIDVDLTPLEKNFQLLNRSSGSKIEILNGSMVSKSTLEVVLLPRKSGNLPIPVLEIDGQRTRPITIEVRQPGSSNGAADRPLFLESAVDEQNPYVQQQVILTLKLYRAIDIQEGSLTVPGNSDLLVKSLGADKTYTEERQGRTWQVLERRYALFPQKSGEMVLPAAMFQGQVLDQRRQRRRGFSGNDPFAGLFGGSPFGGLFQSTRTVRLAAPEITLNIRPQPPGVSGWWLPANKVTLEETWEPDPPKFRVGEPVTRQLRLAAWGLHDSQLPEPPHPIPDGLKIYPDQPERSSRLAGDLLVGELREKQALIPTRAGIFELPEIRLPWWDTVNDRLREAVLPRRTIQVLPAPGESPMPASPVEPAPRTETPPTPMMPETDRPVPKTPTAVVIEPGYWPWLSGFFFTAWILTLVLWWRQRRGVGKKPPVDDPAVGLLAVRKQRRALEKTCLNAAPPQQVRDTLLAWAAAVWPENRPRTLGEVGRRLADPGGSTLLQRLERALYGPRPAWDGAGFWRDLEPLLNKEGTTTGTGAGVAGPTLPPLNP